MFPSTSDYKYNNQYITPQQPDDPVGRASWTPPSWRNIQQEVSQKSEIMRNVPLIKCFILNQQVRSAHVLFALLTHPGFRFKLVSHKKHKIFPRTPLLLLTLRPPQMSFFNWPSDLSFCSFCLIPVVISHYFKFHSVFRDFVMWQWRN